MRAILAFGVLAVTVSTAACSTKDKANVASSDTTASTIQEVTSAAAVPPSGSAPAQPSGSAPTQPPEKPEPARSRAETDAGGAPPAPSATPSGAAAPSAPSASSEPSAKSGYADEIPKPCKDNFGRLGMMTFTDLGNGKVRVSATNASASCTRIAPTQYQCDWTLDGKSTGTFVDKFDPAHRSVNGSIAKGKMFSCSGSSQK